MISSLMTDQVAVEHDDSVVSGAATDTASQRATEEDDDGPEAEDSRSSTKFLNSSSALAVSQILSRKETLSQSVESLVEPPRSKDMPLSIVSISPEMPSSLSTKTSAGDKELVKEEVVAMEGEAVENEEDIGCCSA